MIVVSVFADHSCGASLPTFNMGANYLNFKLSYPLHGRSLMALTMLQP